METMAKKAVGTFLELERLHGKLCEKQLRKINIHRGQQIMLMMLARHKESVSQKTLAQELRISSAATAVGLKRLCAGGYIRKVPSQKDGRYNEITISERGKKVVEQAKSVFDEVDQMMIRGISKEEIACFCDVLAKMKDNLGKEDKK